MRQVSSWIADAVNNRDTWLQRRDRDGYPKLLRRAYTLDALVGLSEKTRYREDNRRARLRYDTDNFLTVAEYSHGMSLVRLLSPLAVDFEGGRIGHPVAGTAYARKLDQGHQYFSLRNANNEPVAIMATHNGRFKAWSREGKSVPQEHLIVLGPFVAACQFKTSISAEAFGYIRDDKGKWHPFSDLPDGLVVPDNLFLGGTGIEVLSGDMIIKGLLDAGNSNLRHLSDGLSVDGFMCISGTNVTRLPRRLVVRGNLLLSGLDIDELPDDINVTGVIYIRGTKIKTLPDTMRPSQLIDCEHGTITAAEFRELNARLEPSF
ncbi:hypothetical protein [Rhizobium sp. MHM7A]|uniref:hypothetical protein n=1 Tax=Rhizobium sp. MHM7A TaxID=2583233 RepID=UPI001105A3A9|nr:hypothetical protein [Rhizobium sp. MHM7A]TLX16587.1 hypothetical protein FFR93_04405 [Rhizobium sp. MHM7A]